MNYIGRYDNTDRLSYYLYNGHGDVVQTVSETGEIENQYDYDIFGNPILTVEVYSNAIRYAGEFFDEETGLYYLRARYYSPYIGRFMSEDSYWGEDTNPLSLNLYTYCYNDPIKFVDPTGHVVSEADKRNLSKADQDEIQKATNKWIEANAKGDKKGMEDAHKEAEAIRAGKGYSGGADGSENKVIKTSSSSSRSKDDDQRISNIESAKRAYVGGYITEKEYVENVKSNISKLSSKSDQENATSYVLGIAAIGSQEHIADIDIRSNNLFSGEEFLVAYTGSGPILSGTSKAGSITLFQHGVNTGGKEFDEMVIKLDEKDPTFIDGGLISLRTDDKTMNVEYSLRLEGFIASSPELKKASEKGTKELVQLLIKRGYHVMFRTEFSNPTGTHEEQITELGKIIDKVSYKDQKVNLVGHSKGGLVSAGYTYRNPDKVAKFISINTPYEPNDFAKTAIDGADAAYKNYAAQAHLDLVVLAASMGSQSDYSKLGGLRDLAGYTSSLSNIRDGWNSAYISGKLDNVDKHAIGVNILGLGGDGVVSIDSQLGGQFLGLEEHRMDSGSIKVKNMHNKRAKNNSLDGLWSKNHMVITKEPSIIEQVYNLLLDKPTSW